MKKPTKHQIETLPFVSVQGVRYVRTDDLLQLLDELEQAERDEATAKAAPGGKDERKT